MLWMQADVFIFDDAYDLRMLFDVIRLNLVGPAYVIVIWHFVLSENKYDSSIGLVWKTAANGTHKIY